MLLSNGPANADGLERRHGRTTRADIRRAARRRQSVRRHDLRGFALHLGTVSRHARCDRRDRRTGRGRRRTAGIRSAPVHRRAGRSHQALLGDHDRRLRDQPARGTCIGARGQLAGRGGARDPGAQRQGAAHAARDAMLSYAAKDMGGAGWAFGLHEALDSIGAVLGPLIAAAVLFLHGGYRHAFAWLLLPALAALATLAIARARFPQPEELDGRPVPDAKALRDLKVFLAATALIAAGYSDFALIAFHLARDHVVANDVVPGLYAVASLAGGLTALALGKLFDRQGLSVLLWSTLVPALYAPLVFLGGPWAALAGMVLWGIGFGAHDSLFRAAVAQRIPRERRATVLGVFNAIYGSAWFAGSVLLGVLYDRNPLYTVTAALVLQIAAVPLLWSLRRSHRTA